MAKTNRVRVKSFLKDSTYAHLAKMTGLSASGVAKIARADTAGEGVYWVEMTGAASAIILQSQASMRQVMPHRPRGSV